MYLASENNNTMTMGYHDNEMGSSSGEYHYNHHYNHHHHRHHHRHHPVKLPYESYKGAFVGDHYRLQQLRLQSDFLDIYAVTCLCGSAFEAQAFSLSCPCGTKLLDSRRRRMKRIYRSQNFVDVFVQAGRRFLVSEVRRSEAEWQNVCHQIRQNAIESGGGGGGGGGTNRHLASVDDEEDCAHGSMIPVEVSFIITHIWDVSRAVLC